MTKQDAEDQTQVSFKQGLCLSHCAIALTLTPSSAQALLLAGLGWAETGDPYVVPGFHPDLLHVEPVLQALKLFSALRSNYLKPNTHEVRFEDY